MNMFMMGLRRRSAFLGKSASASSVYNKTRIIAVSYYRGFSACCFGRCTFGGSHGLRDAGLLEAAVHRPRASFGGEEFYPTVFLKAAALFHSVAMNHAFVDGNKRTAFVAVDVFLKCNRYKITASNRQAEQFTLKVVRKKLNVPRIAEWIRKHAEKR